MKVIKRLIDICVSLVGIIILLPILLIVGILISIKLGSPVLFVQERVGKDNKIFKMYKFRTMKDAKDKHGDLLPDDQRMTKFGAVLRSLSLDELPELFNILKGDMSIIGPRPLLVEYLPLYNERQLKRHNVTPGLTGWAQINGRNLISWEERFELDVWYVENWSMFLDIKIFFLTILKVFRREGINQEGGVTMSKFTGTKTKLKNLVIIGAGGFGREVAWLVDEINSKSKEWNLIGFIDDDKSKYGTKLNGVEVLGGYNYIEKIKDGELYFVCAVGNAKIKKILADKYEAIGLIPATLIHPNVILSEYNEIGLGNVICGSNVITVNVKTGKHVIVNLSCTIGHDVIIEDYVTIYPSVSISGNCTIGECSEIGTRTAIIQGLEIGKNVIVGAGAVVVRSIQKNATAVGVPAKVIKVENVEE